MHARPSCPSLPGAARADLEAAEAAFRLHRASVARWASRRLGAPADVEDAVQEVFLAALRNLPSFRGEAKLSTWLFVITTRVVNEHRRRRLRELARTESAAELIGPTATDAPDRELEAHEHRALVQAALAELPPHYRDVLHQFAVEELRASEVGRRLGTTALNASVRLHRARKALAARIVARVGDAQAA